MFGGLTDMPWHLDCYEAAKKYHDGIKPIGGSGRNAGIRPLCETPSGRKKTQYFIRETEQGIECVLYETPVVTYLKTGEVAIDNEYSSKTTNSFIAELLSASFGLSCSFRDNETWVYSRGQYWWLPSGARVVFEVKDKALVPKEPRLLPRYMANRGRTKRVYARYAAFINHCLVISKVADPKTIYESRYVCQVPIAADLLGSEPDKWGDAVSYFLGNAVECERSWDWGVGGVASRATKRESYHLRDKKVKAEIQDYLKYQHGGEIFEKTYAVAGKYATRLNQEYVL